MAVADEELAVLLEPFPQYVRELVMQVRALVREVVPDAEEELDHSARLLGMTFQPGTYKGLIVAVAPHKAHVNLMFSRGVELLELDSAGLLEGTGKRARHIRFTDVGRLTDPGVRELVRAAAERTPRG
jgi:hypothetical protein